MINREKIIDSARQAAQKAYAVYSEYKVGAALLTADENIFEGCNVENSSYGLTVCAERVAVYKAVSGGYREFAAIAIWSESSPPARPCGACLQVLAEFGSNIDIFCANSKGETDEFKLKELLPQGFRFKAK
jgi:cytidine deaminase